MAVLTHSTPRQVEEYAAAPLESDQRLLASLRRTADTTQQRAGVVMRMAAGTVPPPAVLVWASQQVVAHVRKLVLERLQQRQQQQLGDGTISSLREEPWYGGALQLAQLVSASSKPPSSVPRTDLDLLRAFADPSGTVLSASPAAPTPGADKEAAVEPPTAPTAALPPPWEDLLALPYLSALLDVAAARSPALETTLDLTGLRPAGGAAAAVPSAGMTTAAEPGPSSAAVAAAVGAAAGKGSAKASAALPGGAGSGLLPQLRSAVAVAREKALREAGLLTGEGAEPLDAEAVLTALALGAPPPPPGINLAAGVPAAMARRAAAADWLAAATILQRTAALLGCADCGSALPAAATAGSARHEAVALMQLLGLPLEPLELASLDELKVPEKDLRTWLSQASASLAALPPSNAAVSAAGVAAMVRLPPPLQSRLLVARERLAAGGRALSILDSEPATSPSGTSGKPEEAAPRSPEAAATSAWLRTVGAPLASGLLSGGYGSLARLRLMVPELREALVLRLLDMGRGGGGVTALTAGLYGDAEAAWRGARADVAAAPVAAAMLRQEAVAAALDLVRERFVPPAPELRPPPPLPTDAELAAAVATLPLPARQLYDSYYTLRPDGASAAATAGPAASDAAKGPLAEVLKALEAAGEAAAATAASGELQAWLAEARKELLKSVPPPLLGLLLRFLKVQASITPEEAAMQRNKLTLLMTLVVEQQRRAVETGGSSSSTAAAAAAKQLSEWAAAGAPAAGGSGGGGAQLPAALGTLLGAEGAQDFASWLQALTLNTSPRETTHTILAQQSTEMDVERYLTMTHDSRLALTASGLGGAAPATSADWRHPALRVSEASWLEAMRSQLDAYMQAMGHRRLGEAEWQVYKDAALAEWEAGRQEREERAEAAGESGFWNPRADEVYLQEMLERNINIGDPLGPQSRRYLDTLIRNPSWSFAQRRRAVQRLIQLNAYFVSQPPAPADGSPFAPLFAVGGPDVVPRLGPLPDGTQALGPGSGGSDGGRGGKAAAAAAAVAGGRRALMEQHQLPEGF